LCRASDPDRAPRFREALKRYGAIGAIGDLDDGPEQTALPTEQIQTTVLELLGRTTFDLAITHGPKGEYTRHRRHEECCSAVIALWQAGRLKAKELWLFAYEDGGGAHLPRVHRDAHRKDPLSAGQWLEKRRMLEEVYGFLPNTWEIQAAPREEGFWCFATPRAAMGHLIAKCGAER
jgi:hypothetical protein